MKLTNLKICGIRGFNVEKEINLDDGLTVIYGQNGQGKTSFVEAVEWLLFGTIFKKDKAPSKIEYRDTIKNAHFSNATPYVEAVFNNGKDLIKLRREYLDEERSRFFINDTPSDGICDLGICDIIRPIIYQHGLKSFIHTEPVGRFKEFMRLLNIEEVDTFFRKVRDSQNQYKQDKPKRIRDALLFLKNIEDELPDYHEFLITHNFDILTVSDRINKELKVIDTKITKDNFKAFAESVREIAEKTKKELFDLEIFSPILSYKPTKPDFLEKPEIPKAVKDLSNPDVALAKNRLNVLKNGLKIIEKTRTKECPLCFEKTIDDVKIGFIKSKYQEDDEFERKIKQSHEVIRLYLRAIAQLKASYTDDFRKLIIEEKKIRPCKNLNIDNTILQDFIKKTNCLNEKYGETSSNLESLEKLLENLLHIAVEDKDKIIEDFTGTIEVLKENIQSLNKNVFDLSKTTNEIKINLEKKISSSDKVKRLEILSSIIKNTKTLRILQIDNETEELLNNSLRAVKVYRDQLLERMLSTHKSKIIRWYNILNPNEEVGICDIDCHKDKVDFIATSYGVKTHAVPILSEAHLNCLGLSIYLSKIVNPDNPFSFIFVDDPVQSMDDMHTGNFINDVVEKMIEENYQIFILSHLHKKVYEHILNRYKERTPIAIEFYGCTIEGPKIKIKGKRFDGYISLADQNFNGDVEQRKIAANMIRQAVEAYIKEYYCKKSGQELPDRYKNKTFTVLNDELLSKVEIDPNERGRLRTINSNCNIGSHDDQKSEPPNSPELRNYIDTLKRLYRKHIKGVS